MRMFAVIPVLIVGIVFLVKAIQYFLRIKSDREFVNELNTEYSNKRLAKTGMFAIRDVKIATLFFVLGSILTLDFVFENVNIVPDILVVVALSLSLIYFSKVAKFKKKLVIIMLAVYSVITLFEEYLKFCFFVCITKLK